MAVPSDSVGVTHLIGNAEPKIHRRRIILKDGRYLIFYTFADAKATSPNKSEKVAESEVKRED